MLFWIRIQEDQNDPRKGKRKEKKGKKEKERKISFSFSEELGVLYEGLEAFPGA
jgi:hypothetical protein